MKEIQLLQIKVLNKIKPSKFELFMDNLYYDYHERIWIKDNFEYIPKRVKVEIEDLDRPTLICLIQGHKPNYADLTRKVLDINHLKKLNII